ncbi:MAG: hypothetical protein U0R26_10890 [Solirubrobacterales bacterium]
MPGAAAGLADVVAGHLHPLEFRRRRQHAPQQLAVAGLHSGALAQGQPRLGDPVGQLVSQALQLAEVEDSGLGRDRADPVTHLDPAERLGEEPGELTLEAPDLPPQLVAGEALVDRGRDEAEAVSFEQIRHRPHSVRV